MENCILFVLFDLVDYIHGLEDDGDIVIVSGMQEEICHFALDDVEVVELEDPWGFKDQYFYQFAEGAA